MSLWKIKSLLSFLLVGSRLTAGIVVDGESAEPIGGVSVFDSKGNFLGVSDAKGRLPAVVGSGFPLTLRCIGYNEVNVRDTSGTIRLLPLAYDLPELEVLDRESKMLHLLAYVREFSTLTTYTDTVDMYREKWCDFMVPFNEKSKFKGWTLPRVLQSNSYYRFADCYGLDSVSDHFNNHFTWSDWAGVTSGFDVPREIDSEETVNHALKGKRGEVARWQRKGDKIRVEIDVLADTAGRHWIPGMSRFFEQNCEFDRLKLDYRFEDFVGGKVEARDLLGYSLSVESRGRGRDMFKFNHVDQPFFVSTYAEVFIVDKEVVSVKEAKKWQRMKFVDLDFDGFAVDGVAPELGEETRRLVARVNNIDHMARKLSVKPDPILVGIDVTKKRKSGLLRRLRSMRQSVYAGMAKMNDSKIKKARQERDKKERIKGYESCMSKR